MRVCHASRASAQAMLFSISHLWKKWLWENVQRWRHLLNKSSVGQSFGEFKQENTNMNGNGKAALTTPFKLYLWKWYVLIIELIIGNAIRFYCFRWPLKYENCQSWFQKDDKRIANCSAKLWFQKDLVVLTFWFPLLPQNAKD